MADDYKALLEKLKASREGLYTPAEEELPVIEDPSLYPESPMNPPFTPEPSTMDIVRGASSIVGTSERGPINDIDMNSALSRIMNPQPAQSFADQLNLFNAEQQPIKEPASVIPENKVKVDLPKTLDEVKNEVPKVKAPEEMSVKESKAEKPEGAPVDIMSLIKSIKDERGSGAEIPLLERYKAAQEQARQNRLIGGLSKASEQIGSAIAGVKSDSNYMKDFLADADRPINELLAGEKVKKIENEMESEAKMSDPNSNISKFYRSILAKYNSKINTKDLSAKDMQKLMPTLTNLANAEMARASKLDAAKLKSAEKEEKLSRDISKDKRTFTRQLSKDASSGEHGKAYKAYATAIRSTAALDEFRKDPSGYSDYGTLMSSLKSLQGDDSVVREAEIRLGMQATSALNKVKNIVASYKTGQSLQPEQRKDIIKALTILGDAAKTSYLNGISPIISQAQKNNIPLEDIIPGRMADEAKKFYGLESKSPAGQTTSINKKVKVINPSGKMGMIPESQLKQALSQGYKIAE